MVANAGNHMQDECMLNIKNYNSSKMNSLGMRKEVVMADTCCEKAAKGGEQTGSALISVENLFCVSSTVCVDSVESGTLVAVVEHKATNITWLAEKEEGKRQSLFQRLFKTVI